MPAPLPAGCRERTIATATLPAMHLVESGDPRAPLIVLLHGFPEFWYSWRHQLTALAANFHVVAPDLRGYGGTAKPTSGYDIGSLAGDIDALLAALTQDDVAPRPVTLVGHDWGGVVAWATASLHPARITRLVAIDAPHPIAYLRGLREHPSQLLRSWYIALFAVPGLFEWQFRRDPFGMMARMLRGAAVQRDVFTRDEIGHYVEAMADPQVLPHALAYYRAAAGAMGQLPALRAPVTAPTLVLWGAGDKALGLELIEACRRVVTATFESRVYADAGHWLQQEKPAEVSAAILEFAAR
jgi:pimeloyl-ACP methyl ester carboxylesterase